MAVFLTRFLQASGYFNENDSGHKFKGHHMKVALWIHHLMRAARFNSHEVSQFIPDQERVVRVGVAIAPTLALINHSCDPNYGRVWIKGTSKVAAFATRPIKNGEEVTDSYSGLFGVSTLEERME